MTEHRHPREIAAEIRETKSDDALVAKQARRIDELEEKLAAFENALDEVRLLIFGIGAPLNDDRIGYTREQLVPFFAIADALDLR